MLLYSWGWCGIYANRIDASGFRLHRSRHRRYRRHGYLVPSTGSVEVNGVHLDARDGAAIREEAVVRVTALEDSELVLVDVA